MEASILNSTKKILGIAEEYTAFDLEIITHINSVLTILYQIGIGPEEGLAIEDATATWGDLEITQNELNLVRTYVFLRVRLVFDPPSTSFLLDAMKTQIDEYEQRLSYLRESSIPLVIEEVRGGEYYERCRRIS